MTVISESVKNVMIAKQFAAEYTREQEANKLTDRFIADNAQRDANLGTTPLPNSVEAPSTANRSQDGFNALRDAKQAAAT